MSSQAQAPADIAVGSNVWITTVSGIRHYGTVAYVGDEGMRLTDVFTIFSLALFSELTEADIQEVQAESRKFIHWSAISKVEVDGEW